MWIAEWVVNILAAYAALGVLFAIVFCSVGAAKIDPAARSSGIGFRVMIFPGATALWPLLLTRWIRAGALHE
jgi:hypothetical protein